MAVSVVLIAAVRPGPHATPAPLGSPLLQLPHPSPSISALLTTLPSTIQLPRSHLLCPAAIKTCLTWPVTEQQLPTQGLHSEAVQGFRKAL